jgi:hypothetical protein
MISDRLAVVAAAVCGLMLIHTPLMAESYLDSLIVEAEAQKLASDPMWLSLGHYRPSFSGSRQESLIDDPRFFLAEDGKIDPAAELRATLTGFFADDIADNQEDVQHPQCAFVARYAWLEQKLDFDQRALSKRECARFDAWRKEINAAELALVFPAAFFGNPASMFGHTFLRLDPPEDEARSPLLSYAVSYGADVETPNGLAYAYNGITGGYQAYYAITPYASLVRTYRDLESRDVWEYQLSFSRPEIERLIAHLWELQDIGSEYYFFDENCSYQLMFLFDVARPGLNLADAFALHVIPLDAVRAVLEKRGILKKATFRPSSHTLIDAAVTGLDDGELDIVRDLAAGEMTGDAQAIASLAPSRRAAVLELAEQLVTYRLNNRDLDRDIAAHRALSLLNARSRIDVEVEESVVPTPTVRPDQGHQSARAALGVGQRDGHFFEAFRFRPAYHDRTDGPGGYLPGSAIDVLDVELRHYHDNHEIALERLTLLGILSASPRHRLIRSSSWRLRIGVDRLRIDDTAEGALVGLVDGGMGISSRFGDEAIASALLTTTATGGESCNASCSVALGPSLLLQWPATDRWTLNAEADVQIALGEKIEDRYGLRLSQGLSLSRNIGLKLDAELADEGGGFQAEWLSTLNWYF